MPEGNPDVNTVLQLSFQNLLRFLVLQLFAVEHEDAPDVNFALSGT